MLYSKNNDWYDIVNGDEIEQGDILPNCTIYMFDGVKNAGEINIDEQFLPEWNAFNYDVVVLTQSCDLQVGQGKSKVQHVVLCPIESRSRIEANFNHILHNKGVLRKAAKGEHPGFFVISDFSSAGEPRLNREVGVVHFQQIYTLPVDLVRNHATSLGARLRLRSPYREALSNRFASFFGRVALNNPVNI